MNSLTHSRLSGLYILLLTVASAASAHAQTCLTHGDMDAPVSAALEAAARRYFDMAARGDVASLKQNSIPVLAANFSSIEAAVKDNQANFAGAKTQPRPPFLLKIEGDKPLERAEFLCGVFSKNGQTANSAAFVIPNLAPGSYGFVTLELSGAQKAPTVSFVLQLQGSDWKIGGFYVHASQVAGHDADWFADKAKTFKAKGQNRDAWLYYLQARELAAPVPFMYTQITDKLYDESQAVKPGDLPMDGNTVDLVAAGKTYRLTTMFPVAVAEDVDVVVKYQAADVSHTAETFKDNMAVIHALVSKYPELREAFGGVVARAVEPSGQDYGSMLPMKEIK
ncbi:MAG TPA: hypothetical protein VKR57_09835 [Terriglobales bacterium]|nr:hypothetical protein [Terriglobales bacterium]